ncbi:hypothetical protein B0H14DRAFT_3146537 [Mycena olivaceomarginata]|nr:hypothetical protein B0H14DRAFT_3152742 [Mycena olivaceomarginata]KAJ7821952.1 hypothetical protein B0H14DRAFT_3146537 [Mycena olivaceomarginata]
MASTGERPYTKDDLNVRRADLVRMVQRQLSKWPPKSKFSQSKATIAEMTAMLLDPNNGFTTNKPLIISPHPPKGSRSKSVPAATPEEPPSHPPISPAREPENMDLELPIVRVYIEDCRFSLPQKTVALLSLPVLDRINCAPGGFHVLSKNLVSALQESNSSIEILPDSGGVKISIPDSEDEDWKIPFVRMHHGQFVDEMKFDPSTLEIQESLHIKLFVENLAISALVLKAEAAPVVIPGARPSTSTEPVLDTGPAVPENAALQFLRGRLATRDGYAAFTSHRGRTVPNPDIVQDWQFAVDFKRDYNKLKTPTNIKTSDIQTALGIQSTWLTNAQTAIAIIGTYSKVTEVSAMLALVEDPPKGSIALLNFLVDWKKNHPA